MTSRAICRSDSLPQGQGTRKGGLGQVFLARDVELGRKVALKVIREERADDTEQRTGFYVEALDTANMGHPGVINISDMGQTEDGRPFYTMPVLKQSLRDCIQEYHEFSANAGSAADKQKLRMMRNELLRKFISMCSTVYYVNEKGIVHCDLKPANVMIGFQGETKITDWGLLVRFMPDPDQSDELKVLRSNIKGKLGAELERYLGTINYMSPEQALGRTDMITPAVLNGLLTAFLNGRDFGKAIGRCHPQSFLSPDAIGDRVSYVGLEAVSGAEHC